MQVFERKHPHYELAVYRFSDAFSERPESFLSSGELPDLALMTNDKRRAEYLQSRWQLKTNLSAIGGVPPAAIGFTKFGEGKPVWSGFADKVDFNISHSGEYFAIAISLSGFVGVDIEKIRPPRNLSNIASRFFSAEEAQLIEQTPNLEKQVEIFAKFWSGKEALVKTLGGGVFKNVHDVLIDETTWKIKKLPLEFGSISQWELQFFADIPEYICSLAYKTR